MNSTRWSSDDAEFRHLCNEMLTAIEIREAGVLDWGFINVTLSYIDLCRIIEDGVVYLSEDTKTLWNELCQAGHDSTHILENLLSRKLLFLVGEDKYRTRFAETVRLLHLLRQRFSVNDWQTAPRLVSDVRLHLRRREYPQRNVSLEAVRARLAELRIDVLQERVVTRLLNDPSKGPLILAKFQMDAIEQLFNNLQQTHDSALVIGAGTGAGKTKAFYIPALAYIARHMKGGEYRVQALALYPRRELLKDQFQETYSEARKLDSLLTETHGRPIVLGAYFSFVPPAPGTLLDGTDRRSKAKEKFWEETEHGDGWICPFFDCPVCHHKMVWRKDDVQRSVGKNWAYARLYCSKCHHEVGSDKLLLTRQQMIDTPPDILFTTTEMLNRKLSRAEEHHLFGVDIGNPPRLMLLDEIHTYEGSDGAQVGYLLRRWQNLRKQKSRESLVLIGLSATLKDAQAFFSNLSGIPVHRVTYITPSYGEMIREGVEYNLFVKSDPASGTSLLGTSVQTVMLLARSLDPLRSSDPPSRGAIGQKIFAFSDKLDLINRWNHIEQEVEDERQLSQYRWVDRRDEDTWNLWDAAGQNWWMASQIGHDLMSPLKIGLTTSQYRGVDQEADLTIATSTLEVGYNDQRVGAVIQHKAPRGLASFIQRKGRAGRVRGMRPWTVVVTSDYGQDRWAFQHAETLFEPSVPPLDLPLNNYYVYKIQAAYVLMDWLTLRLKGPGRRADIWRLLSATKGDDKNNDIVKRRQYVIHELRNILLNDKIRKQFENFLAASLQLPVNGLEIQNILWGPPRPLLFHVIPTTIRQLQSNWQRVNINANDDELWADASGDRPLPDFVPTALFDDLNLPELSLRVPKSPKDKHLPIDRGLIEFAPGNVNKRYAKRDDKRDAHWLDPKLTAHTQDHDLGLEALDVIWDEVPLLREIDGIEYKVLRPRLYRLEQTPWNVRSTSTATLAWFSTFVPKSISTATDIDPHTSNQSEPGTPIQIYRRSIWRDILSEIHIFTQGTGSWVEVTRFAPNVTMNIQYEMGNQPPVNRTVAFTLGGHPAAIGFAMDVDALRFRFKSLDVDALRANSHWNNLYRQIGQEYFLYCLSSDPRLSQFSSFTLNRLWEIHLSLLISKAVEHQCSLEEAAQRIRSTYQIEAAHVLNIIFHSVDDLDAPDVGRIREDLQHHLGDQQIYQALFDHTYVLWDDQASGLNEWLERSFAKSLGAALFATATNLLPDINPDDLHLDVFESSIWISESTSGGVGLIAKIAERIAQHPREFDTLLQSTIKHCDRAELSTHLRAITELLQSSSSLQQVLGVLRTNTDLLRIEETREHLSSTLEEHGIPATRSLSVSLGAKLLRTNSGPDTDNLIHQLVDFWEHEEERLRCHIDLRVIAVAAYRQPNIREALSDALRRIGGSDLRDEEHRVFNLLQSLLWLDCKDACSDCIETYQRYQPTGYISRNLLALVAQEPVEAVNFGDPGWEAFATEILSRDSQVRINCTQSDLESCKSALLGMIVEPVEVGYQQFFPTIERIERRGLLWSIYLVLPELVEP